MKLPLNLVSSITLQDFFISHKQLLMRCEMVNENLDILFNGLKYMEIDSFIPPSVLREGTSIEYDDLAKRKKIKIFPNQKLFVFSNDNCDYFILADSIKISKNNLDFMESSIERW